MFSVVCIVSCVNRTFILTASKLSVSIYFSPSFSLLLLPTFSSLSEVFFFSHVLLVRMAVVSAIGLHEIGEFHWTHSVLIRNRIEFKRLFLFSTSNEEKFVDTKSNRSNVKNNIHCSETRERCDHFDSTKKSKKKSNKAYTHRLNNIFFFASFMKRAISLVRDVKQWSSSHAFYFFCHFERENK